MADADRWWTGRIADPDVLSEMRSLDFDTYDSDGLRNLIHSDIYDSRRSRTSPSPTLSTIRLAMSFSKCSRSPVGRRSHASKADSKRRRAIRTSNLVLKSSVVIASTKLRARSFSLITHVDVSAGGPLQFMLLGHDIVLAFWVPEATTCETRERGPAGVCFCGDQ